MTFIFLILGLLIVIASWVIYYKLEKKGSIIVLLIPIFISGIVFWHAIKAISAPIDTRLIEYPAITLRHYPIWDEEICSIEDGRGITTSEAYPVEHHEYWAMMYLVENEDTAGMRDKREELEIPESTYSYYKNLWDKQELNKEKDTTWYKRDYTRHYWDNDIYNSLVYTKTQPYKNYFKNIYPFYNIHNVSNSDIMEYDLYTYAPLTSENSERILEPRQTLIYGLEVPDSISRALSYISTVDHKFRPIILVWIGRGKRDDMIKKQRNYWEGGKDNEAVFCVSINDTIRKEIMWSGSFSWAKNKDFENYVISESLNPGDSLNLETYIKALMNGYKDGLWQPRDFSTYSVASLPADCFIYIFLSLLIIILDCILAGMLKAKNLLSWTGGNKDKEKKC